MTDPCHWGNQDLLDDFPSLTAHEIHACRNDVTNRERQEKLALVPSNE